VPRAGRRFTGARGRLLLEHRRGLACDLLDQLARSRQRYVTGDEPRNNWLLALLTMGEGWHNNHRARPRHARGSAGESVIQFTIHCVCWELRLPSRTVIKGEHRLGRLVTNKVADQLAASFPINQIARHAVRRRRSGTKSTCSSAEFGRRSPSCPETAGQHALIRGDRRTGTGKIAGAYLCTPDRGCMAASSPQTATTG
jgi:hypothetical protein